MSGSVLLREQSNAFFIVLSNLPQNFMFSESSLFISEPSDTNQVNNCIHTYASSLSYPHPPNTHKTFLSTVQVLPDYMLHLRWQAQVGTPMHDDRSPSRQNIQRLSSQNKKTGMATLNLQQPIETTVLELRQTSIRTCTSFLYWIYWDHLPQMLNLTTHHKFPNTANRQKILQHKFHTTELKKNRTTSIRDVLEH
jgi:hypothetical protein